MWPNGQDQGEQQVSRSHCHHLSSQLSVSCWLFLISLTDRQAGIVIGALTPQPGSEEWGQVQITEISI